MEKVLLELANKLNSTIAAVNAHVGHEVAFNLASNNWSFPGISKLELSASLFNLEQQVREKIGVAKENENQEKFLADYVLRFEFIRTNTVPQIPSNAQVAIEAISQTLLGLGRLLDSIFPPDANILAFQVQKEQGALKQATDKIRNLEARLALLEPKSNKLDKMVSTIETAYQAADRLPTDVKALQDAYSQIQEIKIESNLLVAGIKNSISDLERRNIELFKTEENALQVLEKANAAYAASTSTALGMAFAAREDAYKKSAQSWVLGLIVALIIGGVVGHLQFTNLIDSIKLGKDLGIILLYSTLAVFSVGGPIWFAWLSTKNISQSKKLGEDYGFKASISTAYEGYRLQANAIDPEFQKTLFASALTRLDEQPLRLVEGKNPGSPFHEILSSDIFKQAIRSGPDFLSKAFHAIDELAREAISSSKNVSKLKTSQTEQKG